jgi:hypothetical protein
MTRRQRPVIATVAPVRAGHWSATRRGRLKATAAIVLTVTLLTVACSDDDSTATDSMESTTSSRPTTTTTEADDGRSALEQQIEGLLRRYDDVTAEIVADPDIAGDREHPLYAELLELLVPETEMTRAVVSSLVQRGERGEYQLPVEGAQRPVERRLDGSVDRVSDNEVSFPLCTLLQYRDFDQQDRQRRILPGLVEAGTGYAMRVGGEWRLSRLETGDRTSCAEGQR